MQIVGVESAPRMAQVRELFEEYWASFGFTPCFQNFGAEVAGLPGDYTPPGGRLALAMINGQAAGCVALRQFDAQRCEAKRLFVRPQFRNRGVGRQLLDWVIEEVQRNGGRHHACDGKGSGDVRLAGVRADGALCRQGYAGGDLFEAEAVRTQEPRSCV